MNMHLHSLVAAALLIPLTASAQEKAAATNGVAMVINGKVIAKADFNRLIEDQRNYIRQTAKNEEEQKKLLAELDGNPVNFLVEYQKTLADFEKTGGSIRPEYADGLINNLVHDKYGGDRSKLDAGLARNGLTPAKFRRMMEEQITVRVMRERAKRKTAEAGK